MILRIRLPRGRPVERRLGKNRHVALALGAMFTPLALMAYVLGCWRLAADMGFASPFAITGLFSHWQIWMIAGVALQAAGAALNRYGQGSRFQIPRVLPSCPRPAKEPARPRKVGTP
ncbi:MAG TPA: hypothetical protein VKX39_14375 [Bryobacteraceae bacterium]|jgi:hypothetical protein|nr:hypothetical protein [Bryobacteraceae bacterium]